MDRESIDRWCERGILGLTLAVLGFGPLAFGAVRIQEFLVLQGLTTGALGLWLARLWLDPKPKLLWPPVGWFVLAFLGYAIGRYLTSEVEYVARQELLRVLLYSAVFFIVLNNLHRQESTQIITYALVLLGMAISFYASYQFLTKSDRVWGVTSAYRGRGTGTYLNPNHLAGLLELLLPLALAYAITGRGKVLAKIFLGYAAAVMIFGIAASGSRGSWAAVVIALFVFSLMLLYHRSFRLPGLALFLILVSGGLVAANKTEYFKARISTGTAPGKVDFDTRLKLWQSALQMWQDHPWVGVGPGQFDLRFPAYRPPLIQLRPERVHNEYLNTLADWGIIGAILVGGALLTLAYGLNRVWRSLRRSENDLGSNFSNKLAFVLGGTVALLALLVHSITDFNLHIPANAIVAATIVALLSSHWRFATDRYWFSVRWPGKTMATAAIGTAIAYFGIQSVGLGREAHWITRAETAAVRSMGQAELLVHAASVEPHNPETTFRIAEAFRLESFAGRAGYEELADRAIGWYQRGITNNPYDAYNYMSWGTVLDFLNRPTEAEPLFLKAVELDPSGYNTSAYMGRHYVEAGEYAAARPWLERSLVLHRTNEVATVNLQIAIDRLREAAADPLRRSLRERLR